MFDFGFNLSPRGDLLAAALLTPEFVANLNAKFAAAYKIKGVASGASPAQDFADSLNSLFAKAYTTKGLTA